MGIKARTHMMEAAVESGKADAPSGEITKTWSYNTAYRQEGSDGEGPGGASLSLPLGRPHVKTNSPRNLLAHTDVRTSVF